MKDNTEQHRKTMIVLTEANSAMTIELKEALEERNNACFKLQGAKRQIKELTN